MTTQQSRRKAGAVFILIIFALAQIYPMGNIHDLGGLSMVAMKKYAYYTTASPSEGSSLEADSGGNPICGAQTIDDSKQQVMMGLKPHKRPMIWDLSTIAPRESHVCIPPKNGSRQFALLLHAATQGKPPKTVSDLVDSIDSYDTNSAVWKPGSVNGTVLFIARNPYTRFLSLYLQKVAQECSVGDLGCDGKFVGMGPGTTFHEYTKRIYRHYKQGKSICELNGHLCRQVETCVAHIGSTDQVSILKSEEEPTWFPCLVDYLQIPESTLLGQGWEQFGGKSCYYTPTDDCKDMLRVVPNEERKMVTGGVHATGATERVSSFYDQELAAMVHEMYEVDFRILGYPIWNGP